MITCTHIHVHSCSCYFFPPPPPSPSFKLSEWPKLMQAQTVNILSIFKALIFNDYWMNNVDSVIHKTQHRPAVQSVLVCHLFILMTTLQGLVEVRVPSPRSKVLHSVALSPQDPAGGEQALHPHWTTSMHSACADTHLCTQT